MCVSIYMSKYCVYNCTASVWHRINNLINLCLWKSVPFLLYMEEATHWITSSCYRHYRRNGTEYILMCVCAFVWTCMHM